MKRSRPISLALVGLFLWLNACTSYKQIGQVEVADYGKARVTLDDGSQFVVAHPQIEADSLVGFRADSWSAERRVYTEGVRSTRSRRWRPPTPVPARLWGSSWAYSLACF